MRRHDKTPVWVVITFATISAALLTLFMWLGLKAVQTLIDYIKAGG